MPERYLVTSALPYVNALPHVGNLVGSHLPADIFARYCRKKGRETIFIGGTDEHGTPIVLAAQKKGVTPKVLCDEYYSAHKKIYDWFGFSYDNFSRTSKPGHYKTTQEFFLTLKQNGFISEADLRLPFCEKCARFLPDRYVEGICPKCGAPGARGDQCEKCSSLLDPAELKEPYCVACKSTPIFKTSRHLFLELGKLAPKVSAWIESNPNLQGYTKTLSQGIIANGLTKRCITRDIDWGVPVPVPGFEDKVFYVWFDAPIGYISNTNEIGKAEWYTDKENTRIVHFLGKDNIPFHTIFFPAMLLGHGGYALPFTVVGSHFLNHEGKKISKSKGIGVFCDALVASGVQSDVWRFYLTLKIPEGKDADFSWKEFQNLVNAELVGNFSNFMYRATTFIQSKFSGAIPEPSATLTPEDTAMLAKITEAFKGVDEELDNYRIVEALKKVLWLSDAGNKYLQAQAPWANAERSPTVLFVCANVAAALANLISPFLPSTSEKSLALLNAKPVIWDGKQPEILLAGKHVIAKPEMLFKPIDDKELARLEELTTKKS